MAVVTIEELDPASLDEGTLAELAELTTVEEGEASPDDPPIAVAEEAAQLRERAPHQELFLWAARDPDGRLLGRVVLEVEHRKDNQHLAEVEVVVRSEHRRQGIGRRLVGAAAERARAEGRTTLMSEAVMGRDGEAAVRALGGEIALVNRISRLRTAELDRSLLRTWVERAAERAAGYSLVAFDGPCPDDLLEQFTRVVAVMNTAPRGDMDMEDEAFTPELVKAQGESYAARGYDVWIVAVRHDATGDLVGYTALLFPEHRPWQGLQGDTGVDPAHRNKGLGRWLKAVNLLRLAEERPAVQVVDTENAGSNDPMLNINVALGFRPLAETATVQLKLG